MSSKAFAAGILLALAPCAAWAQAPAPEVTDRIPLGRSSPPDFKANILIVTSPDEVPAWMQMTPDQQVGAGRMRQVEVGQKIYFPIVATGLTPPAEGTIKLTADFELRTPEGAIAYAKRALATAVIENRPDMTTVSLGPIVDVTVEGADPKGVYVVRTVISDGTRSAAASETFRFNGAPEMAPERAIDQPAAAAPPPRLDMGEPPKKNPGTDRDVRDCLSLATTAEIIKCTEKKKAK
jgi:hypothetical protein